MSIVSYKMSLCDELKMRNFHMYFQGIDSKFPSYEYFVVHVYAVITTLKNYFVMRFLSSRCHGGVWVSFRKVFFLRFFLSSSSSKIRRKRDILTKRDILSIFMHLLSIFYRFSQIFLHFWSLPHRTGIRHDHYQRIECQHHLPTLRG